MYSHEELEMIPLSAEDKAEIAELLYETEKVKVEILKEFTPSSLKAKSEVTISERYNFARLELLVSPFKNVDYQSNMLRKFINEYLEYGISLHRKGRQETKEVIESFYNSSLGDLQQLAEQTEEKELDKREKLRRLLLT